MQDTGHNTRARTYVRADDSSLTGKRPSLVALPALTFSARNAGSAGRFCVSLLYYARARESCGAAGEMSQAVGQICGAAGESCGAAGESCGAAGESCGAAGECCGAAGEVCGAAREYCGAAGESKDGQ